MSAGAVDSVALVAVALVGAVDRLVGPNPYALRLPPTHGGRSCIEAMKSLAVACSLPSPPASPSCTDNPLSVTSRPWASLAIADKYVDSNTDTVVKPAFKAA